MRKPLVSVIIPSFNHAKYIEQAIQSVFEQTYPHLELIIIDDGSTDLSVTVIEKTLAKWKKKKPMVKVYFERQQNQGAHVTINKGLKLAHGEFLTILNSDDYYYKNRLEILYTTAVKHKAEFVISYVEHVNSDGSKLDDLDSQKYWYLKEDAGLKLPSLGFRLLWSNLAVTTGNFFFRKEVFEAVGGFNDYMIMHDYDFILRSLFYTEPVLVKKKLMAYRVHPENTITRYIDLSLSEGRQISYNYFKEAILQERPRNKLAPCPQYWKSDFRKFFEIKGSWFGNWISRLNPADYIL